MTVHRTILTGAVLLAVTTAATPAKATSVDLLDVDLGTLASVWTPLAGVGQGTATYSANFIANDLTPENTIIPGYQGASVGTNSIFADGTQYYNGAYSVTGASDFTYGFSFTPANNGTFTSSGGTAEAYTDGSLTSVSLYAGSSLIENASLTTSSYGGGYAFDPIDVLAGSNYTLDIAGSVGAVGQSEISGTINIASARSAVPLPASLPLFATAILALMGFAAVKRVRERSQRRLLADFRTA